MKTVTFNNSPVAKKVVLRMLGMSVDKQDYIINTKTKERVLSPMGKEVLLEDFAGMRKGSVIVITKDLPSVLAQAEYTSET